MKSCGELTSSKLLGRIAALATVSPGASYQSAEASIGGTHCRGVAPHCDSPGGPTDCRCREARDYQRDSRSCPTSPPCVTC